MNAQSKVEAAPLVGLDLLRAPFPEHHISKLPKETGAQIDARKADKNLMVWNCAVCGGHHHAKANHLDYVGHAALTDRLLDTDPEWSWEPLALTEMGLPAFDQTGGLWIKLTVCGVTRLGYGHAAVKPNMDPGAREKEVIGDALRNAAMRFGAALDLWHKGDLHLEDQNGGGDNAESQMSPAAEPSTLRDQLVQSVAQEVHHDDTGIQPDKPKAWREPDSMFSTPSKLHAGLARLERELQGCGDTETLDCLTLTPEWIEFIRVATLHAPHYLYGGDPAPEEFKGLLTEAQKLRDEYQLAVANGMVDMVRAG